MLNKAGPVSEQFIGSKTRGRHEMLTTADGKSDVFLKYFWQTDLLQSALKTTIENPILKVWPGVCVRNPNSTAEAGRCWCHCRPKN